MRNFEFQLKGRRRGTGHTGLRAEIIKPSCPEIPWPRARPDATVGSRRPPPPLNAAWTHARRSPGCPCGPCPGSAPHSSSVPQSGTCHPSEGSTVTDPFGVGGGRKVPPRVAETVNRTQSNGNLTAKFTKEVHSVQSAPATILPKSDRMPGRTPAGTARHVTLLRRYFRPRSIPWPVNAPQTRHGRRRNGPRAAARLLQPVVLR